MIQKLKIPELFKWSAHITNLLKRSSKTPKPKVSDDLYNTPWSFRTH
ncbi:hypothetical protein [Neisseria sicca]|nr:hypothetical protein [Neisseria sicca]